MKRPLFAFAVLFLGALAATRLWGGFSGFLAAGGTLLVSVCLPKGNRELGRQLLFCGAAASVAALAVWSLFDLRLADRKELEGRTVSFSGWMEEVSPYDPARVTLRGRAVWQGGEGRVHLTFPGMTEEAAPGDWLAGSFLVLEAREEGEALGGITLLVRAEEPPAPIPAPPGFHPLAKTAALRWRLSQKLWEARPGEDTAVILSLVFSRRDKLPARRLAELDRAGMRHLLVVSGLHLSLLLGWLGASVRRLGLGPRPGSILGLLGVWLLAGMAGFSIPVIRAGLMTGLCYLGQLLYRRSDGLTSLGFSGMVLAALSPPVLFHAGWQLTLAATLGLLLGEESLSALPKDWLTGRFGRVGRLSGWAVEGLAASASAQLGALPVLAARFGRVTLWGLVTTLPAIPLVTGGILLGGAGTLLLSLPVPEAAGLFLLDAARFCARLLLGLAGGVSGLADLSFPVLLPWQLALCAVIPLAAFFCLGLIPRLTRRRERRALCGCLLLTFLALGGLWYSGRRAAVVSLGENGSVVLALPSGTLVMDPGETAWDRRVLEDRLLRCGARGPLTLAFSQGFGANALLGWQRDFSPAALCLPAEEIPLLEHQFPGNYLSLETGPQEVLPGVFLSSPSPGCLLVEAGGKKALKYAAPYAGIKDSPLLEEADLLVDRQGNAFTAPGGPKPVRMPTGDRNLVVWLPG